MTLGQVNDFKPTIKVLSVDDFPHTYHKLNATNMPADAFINDALTPLPDMVRQTPSWIPAACKASTQLWLRSSAQSF